MKKDQMCAYNEQMSLLMSLALDGLLDDDEQHRLDRHLAGCAMCQAEWQAMQRVSTLLEEEPMLGPPLGFALRIERRLAARAKPRRRMFGGLAMLTSSVSLAVLTVAVVAVITLGLVAWPWLSSLPSVQERAGAVSQVASGIGLMGKGMSLFLGDLLLRYGAVAVFVIGTGLVLLAAVSTWLLIKRPGGYRPNGYA
jgi:anti-sigma factor RsiW